jgi:hypothetical protein
MQFVEGVTLAEHIHGKHAMSLVRKLELMEDLSLGLDYAHNKGVVHRDVKPANLMLDREGVLKIVDFGIAHIGNSNLTLLGTMMGTPNYMSPEQIEGKPVDRRSDVFAVGLVFYELLSYRQAFPGDTIHQVMHAITQREPLPLAQLCPDLASDVMAIVTRAIRKDPARRYQTLGILAADVSRARKRIAPVPETVADQADARAGNTTVVTPTPLRTPRLGTERELLLKRRRERVDSQLAAARSAYEAADYAGALEACEQAALIDQEDPRVLELLERSREQLDRQCQEWLTEARQYAECEDLDRAADLVARALQLDPSSEEARSFEAALAERQRQRQEEQQRRLALNEALKQAETHLAAGHPERALRAAGDALVHDPANSEAHEVMRRAFNLLDERRRLEAQEQAARAAVTQAKEIVSADRWQEAIELLERFTPPLGIVTAALNELRAERIVREQALRETEERRRLEETEAEQRRDAPQRWVARQLDVASKAIDDRQFEDAIEMLQHVEGVSSAAPEVATLLNKARKGQAALASERQRQEHLEDLPAQAATAHAAGQLADELALVGKGLAIAPEEVEAQQLHNATELALERQQALETEAVDKISTARQRFDAGEHAAAIALLDAFASPHPLVAAARMEMGTEAVRAAHIHAERALAERRFDEAFLALQEADAVDSNNAATDALRTRILAERVEAHRQGEILASTIASGESALDAGDISAAMRFADAALVLDATSAAAQRMKDRAVGRQDEARRHAEHDRRAEQAVSDARHQFAAGDTAGALAILEFFPAHAAVSEALSELRAELSAREQRRQQELAERQRRSELIERALTSGQDALNRGDFDAAVRLADETLSLDPGNLPAQLLKVRARARSAETVKRTEQAQRRQEEAKALAADARATLARNEVSAASVKLRDALALDPKNPALIVLDEKVQTAIIEQALLEARELSARSAVEDARRLAADDRLLQAIARLERANGGHRLVAETLDLLRRDLATREQRASGKE